MHGRANFDHLRLRVILADWPARPRADEITNVLLLRWDTKPDKRISRTFPPPLRHAERPSMPHSVCRSAGRRRIMVDMQTDGWFNQDHHFAPGRHLFQSQRSFAIWAYTVSHSQLLLRTRTADGRSRIDVLFKPVAAMKIRANYRGLSIRSATADEYDQIMAQAGLTPSRDHRVLLLESSGEPDYVITGAVGWREDDRADNDPSALATLPPGTDPNRILHHPVPDALNLQDPPAPQ